MLHAYNFYTAHYIAKCTDMYTHIKERNSGLWCSVTEVYNYT